MLKETQWESLLWSLRQGQCVLLLGDEASRPSGQSLKTALALELAHELGLPPATPSSTILLRYEEQEGRNALEARVVRFYRDGTGAPTRLHHDLAVLPFTLLLTSCHDAGVAQALAAAGRPPQATCYDFGGPPVSLASEGSVERPLVFGLLGSPERSRSLVLTEYDLLEFLVHVVSGNPPLPERILSAIRDPAKTFLFLGFGVRHWHTRILLRVLELHRTRNRSLALEELEPPPADLEQTVLFYRSGYRIEVIPADVGGFVAELRRRYEATQATVPAPPVAVAAPPELGRPPRVFICHAKEDREAARRLFEALKRDRLDPWFDESSLEVGEAWDLEIEAEIKKADYFVVLLSRHLEAKVDSYVNKEINRALDRREYFRPGTRFILPLALDDAPLLPALAEIQAEPLKLEADGVSRLVSLVYRDFQLRQRASR
jgi:hypothetical protein